MPATMDDAEERQLILMIVEGWGNSLCPIEVMADWLIQYRDKKTIHLRQELENRKGRIQRLLTYKADLDRSVKEFNKNIRVAIIKAEESI